LAVQIYSGYAPRPCTATMLRGQYVSYNLRRVVAGA
jgi:hypothetical protein